MNGSIASINTSDIDGEKKMPVLAAVLLAGRGVKHDSPAGCARQVSLLSAESIDSASESGLDLRPGDFGENITTYGFDLGSVRIGERIRVGSEVVLQISEIGKVCQTPCDIGERLGDCIIPCEGVFARVQRGGMISPGDSVERTDAKVAAVLTSSDRCVSGERDDESGFLLLQLLDELGVLVADYSVLPDDESVLSEHLRFLADSCAVDMVLTTGGTGFTLRDRMPEATLAVLDSPAPGIAEAVRYEGLKHTPYACISRGISGLRGRTLIVNLPGSKRAIKQIYDLLTAVIPHTLEAIRMEIADCGTKTQPPAINV